MAKEKDVLSTGDVTKIRVLIMDPILSRITAEDGFELQFADGAFEAGSAVERFKPHVLVITILTLGVEDICETIRADKELTNIKIILTANKPDTTSFRELSKKNLFDGFIIRCMDKLFEAKKLFEKIKEILK